ncbi:MAG: NTP transferase domain-containing protein [Candidatus Aenigmarchaeota archaeon]|nr:NTP transferase domain-containing protein [Candidatus Aenigmarchaeota archaeon]
MKNEPVIGLIPAAGSGTRLYPFSRAVPKEMYPILGKAVIEHCVENLRAGGVEKVFIIVGHQKGAIMDYIGDGSFFGVKAAYIFQMMRKGLGHAILQARNWIQGTFITILGDSFIEPKEEIKDLIDLHQRHKPVATLLVFEVDDPSEYGVVKLGKMLDHHGDVQSLAEKPAKEKAKEFANNDKYYAITGAYVFEPKIFDYIDLTKAGGKGEVQITDAIALAIEKGEKVMALILKGKYIDIGKWQTIFDVEAKLLRAPDTSVYVKDRERIMRLIKDLENSNMEK